VEVVPRKEEEGMGGKTGYGKGVREKEGIRQMRERKREREMGQGGKGTLPLALS